MVKVKMVFVRVLNPFSAVCGLKVGVLRHTVDNEWVGCSGWRWWWRLCLDASLFVLNAAAGVEEPVPPTSLSDERADGRAAVGEEFDTLHFSRNVTVIARANPFSTARQKRTSRLLGSPAHHHVRHLLERHARQHE